MQGGHQQTVSGLPEKSNSAAGPRTISCPKCGFDIEQGKPCQVCGYSPSSRSTRVGGASAPVKAARRRGGGTLLALLLSAGGLVGLLAVFLVTTELRRPNQSEPAQSVTDAASSTAQTPVSAADAPAGSAATDASAAAPVEAPAAVTPPAAATAPTAGTPAAAATPPAAVKASPAFLQPAAARVSARPPVSQPLQAPVGGILLNDDETPFDVAGRTDLPPFDDRDGFVDWMVKHTDENAKFLKQKWERAQVIQRLGNFTHDRVKQAFLLTPREFFSRDTRRSYENAVLPIGYGQTISGPHLVSRMTDYLDPQPEQKVLEIGTGSGYQAALLSEISNHVFTIEIVERLARETDTIFKRLEPRYPEYRNIRRKVDDGYYGWEQYAPFDRIIVTCGIDHVPPALIQQLAPDGIMVIPIGPPSGQTILRIMKKVSADGTVSLEREDIYHGKKKQIFVPFTARGGGVHRSDDQKD